MEEDYYGVEQESNNRYVKAPNKSNKPMIPKGFTPNQGHFDNKRGPPGLVP